MRRAPGTVPLCFSARKWMATLLVVLFGLLAPVSATAQDKYARRDYSTPGLIVETGTRRGFCDALLFSPDGSHLLAAGDDKVVQNWQYG